MVARSPHVSIGFVRRLSKSPASLTQLSELAYIAGLPPPRLPLSLDYHVSSPGWESNKAIPTG
jgi:hypothetical protein